MNNVTRPHPKGLLSSVVTLKGLVRESVGILFSFYQNLSNLEGVALGCPRERVTDRRIQ